MSEINIMDFDPSSSIKSYNFTNTAIRRFYDTIDSEQFKDEKKEKIFEYLTGEMEIVPFNDQLKRYLYEKNQFSDTGRHDRGTLCRPDTCHQRIRSCQRCHSGPRVRGTYLSLIHI